MNKSILLIGNNGLLGSELLNNFYQTGDSQIISSQLLKGSDYKIDITNYHDLFSILNIINPSIIINTAAFTAVDDAELNSKKSFLVNSEGPKYLASWCKKNSSYLIHISTDYVFSGENPLYFGYKESDKIDPQSVYGRSKMAGEINITQIMPENYLILRTSWLYGFYGKNFLKTIFSLNQKEFPRKIKIVDDQFGSPTSTYSLCEIILFAIRRLFDDLPLFGTFHSSSNGYCSWYQFAKKFFEELSIESNLYPCSTSEYPTRALRPKNSILDNYRLKKMNIDSFLPWEDDLVRFISLHGKSITNNWS